MVAPPGALAYRTELRIALRYQESYHSHQTQQQQQQQQQQPLQLTVPMMMAMALLLLIALLLLTVAVLITMMMVVLGLVVCVSVTFLSCRRCGTAHRTLSQRCPSRHRLPQLPQLLVMVPGVLLGLVVV
jgi:uncharacterized membrane protein